MGGEIAGALLLVGDGSSGGSFESTGASDSVSSTPFSGRTVGLIHSLSSVIDVAEARAGFFPLRSKNAIAAAARMIINADSITVKLTLLMMLGEGEVGLAVGSLTEGSMTGPWEVSGIKTAGCSSSSAGDSGFSGVSGDGVIGVWVGGGVDGAGRGLGVTGVAIGGVTLIRAPEAVDNKSFTLSPREVPATVAEV